jgi:hypothetical protein
VFRRVVSPEGLAATGWAGLAGCASTRAPASATAAPPQSPAGKPVNLILIVSDDHRWDAMGCMGHPILRTPNLDALAGDHGYLLAGGVFSQELIDDWIGLKRQEVEELEQQEEKQEM